MGEIEREMCPWAISIIVLVIRCPTHCSKFISTKMQIKEQEEKEWRRSGCNQPNQHQPVAHRTVRWCTRQCPVPWLARRRTGCSRESAARRGYKSQDYPVVYRTVQWVFSASAQALRRRTRRSRKKEKASRLKITGLSSELKAHVTNDVNHLGPLVMFW
jgi:hypothetical protein